MGRVLRVEDWPLRLNRTVEAARGRAFQWGKHDCVTWAAEIVLTLTGTDLNLPNNYRTAKGSMMAMRRTTGSTNMSEAVTYFLGEPMANPKLAQRGDIVLYGTRSLGVCVGAQALCLSETGLEPVPLTDCSTAWRV